MQVQCRGLMACWYLDCYTAIETEGLFPVASYLSSDFLDLWQDIKNVFTNPNSGIKMVVLWHYPSNKIWHLYSMEDAKEKVGYLVLLA